jgi:hypothetical protein
VGERLDAIIVGAADPDVQAHVAKCEVCAAYVASLTRGAEAFAQHEGARADDFVRRVRAREAASPAPLRAAAPTRAARWIGVAAPVVALAAGVVLYVGARGTHDHGGPGPVSTVVDPGEGPARFKGGAQVAVIVDHAGAQTRRTGEVAIAPGDRIRLEIGVDRDAQLTAGVLAESGEWAELQPPALFPVGTRYSEQSITFDADVPNGWVLVGTEQAVARARTTRDFRDVIAVRVRPTSL